MSDEMDPRIIAAMYSSENDTPKVPTTVVEQPLNESAVDNHKNVSVLKLNKHTVVVPNVRYMQEISKELTTAKSQLRSLTSENRQLKQALRAMANDIKLLRLALDNKVDKF